MHSYLYPSPVTIHCQWDTEANIPTVAVLHRQPFVFFLLSSQVHYDIAFIDEGRTWQLFIKAKLLVTLWVGTQLVDTIPNWSSNAPVHLLRLYACSSSVRPRPLFRSGNAFLLCVGFSSWLNFRASPLSFRYTSPHFIIALILVPLLALFPGWLTVCGSLYFRDGLTRLLSASSPSTFESQFFLRIQVAGKWKWGPSCVGCQKAARWSSALRLCLEDCGGASGALVQ